MKRSYKATLVKARAEELQRQNPSPAPATALAKAIDENPEIVRAYRELRETEAEAEVEDPYVRAERQRSERLAKLRQDLNRADFLGLVNQIKKERPDLTDGQAWNEAHHHRPDLYARARTS